MAVEMMGDIIRKEPENEKAQVRRVELLMHSQRPDMRRSALLDEGQGIDALFRELLLKYPENQLIRRSFVQWVVRPFGKRDLETLERAARFARSLLADDPGSTELMMLYIAARDRFSSALAAAGEVERAHRENEMTLGVISLITTRSDYTPEMRERLAVLVSMHPQADAARTQQEAEISLLLESMDEKRMQEVRQRIKSMRSRRPRPGKGGPRPPKRNDSK